MSSSKCGTWGANLASGTLGLGNASADGPLCPVHRPYWRCYYANTDGIVFVVDSADVDRAGTAKTELLSMLQEEELKGVPLLVLANKQVWLVRAAGTCR